MKQTLGDVVTGRAAVELLGSVEAVEPNRKPKEKKPAVKRPMDTLHDGDAIHPNFTEEMRNYTWVLLRIEDGRYFHGSSLSQCLMRATASRRPGSQEMEFYKPSYQSAQFFRFGLQFRDTQRLRQWVNEVNNEWTANRAKKIDALSEPAGDVRLEFFQKCLDVSNPNIHILEKDANPLEFLL